MSLTVREKEHWKERISRRIDCSIQELEATFDSRDRETINQQADDRAWESFGLTALRQESQKIAEQEKALKSQSIRIWRQMYATVKGVPLDDVTHGYTTERDVIQEVERRRKVFQREILATTSIGQKILKLEQEKEELLDTVWLATSPAQIKELWGRFAELLSWEPTDLQKEALSLQPTTDPA